jgi:2-polyprenyl-6-methoxyphenol hydroxylase-like FAD-dependent oxidoreductase
MKILIIGAGIAGLSSAIALKRLGFSVTIIEKSPSLRYEGVGIALPLNAVNGLIYLGLKDKLLAKAHAVKKIVYLTEDGSLMGEASLLQKPFGEAPFVSIYRKVLIEILAEAACVNIKFGVMADLHETQAGIDVTFSNGENDNYDLVIAADGVYSKTKKSLFDNYSLEDLGLHTCRFVAKIKIEDPTYYFGKKSAFMFYPLNKDETYCYLHHADLNLEPFRKISKHDLLHLFDTFDDQVKHALSIAEEKDLIFGPLISVKDPVLRLRNIAFVGDAAHACSPMLQQGAAKAIEDAITLALMLKSLNDVSSALNHYEKFRMQRIKWITQNSDIPIKKFANTLTAAEFELLKQQVKIDGPINITKWKELFDQEYISSLNNYVAKLKESCIFFNPNKKDCLSLTSDSFPRASNAHV